MQLEALDFGPGLRCLLGVPDRIDASTPLFACVHGVRRNAQEHFGAFAPLARRVGWLLIAPRFDAEVFPDYQRLGRPGKGARADLSLIDLVSRLSARFSLPDRPFYLFGHSGGGQFAHRFVMAHPDRVERYAVSAPGWYTFPDETLRYPYGLAQVAAQCEPMQPAAFLKIPGAVFVGTGDYRSGRHLRCNPTVDRNQGPHRLERARRWTSAMNARARQMGLAEPLELHQLEGGAHCFGGLMRRNRLHEHAWRFLTGAATA